MYRAAALLHDIGHYPFSHAMERAVNNFYKSTLLSDADGSSTPEEQDSAASLNHEELGMEIIAGSQSEVSILLQQGGVDPNSLVAILQHAQDAPAFSNIISSDLDADRIDYLLRTAHHTGLPYGHIDLEYLLAMLRSDKHSKLCLDERALRTAEHLLLARYFDYQQVSFHKTVTAYEELLEDVLFELMKAELLDCSPGHLKRWVLEGRWAEFDDAYIWSAIRNLAELPRNSSAGVKASALLDRRGPKLLFSKEFFTDSETSPLRDLRHLVNSALDKVAETFGISREYFYLWTDSKPFTSLGSKVEVQRANKPLPDDEESFGQLVRMANRDGTSTPLINLPHSVMYVLSNFQLSSIRLYVLLPNLELEDRRSEVIEAFLSHMPDHYR